MRRFLRGSILAPALLVAGCVAASPSYIDGHYVEGVAVSNAGTPIECCGDIWTAAKSALLARLPDAIVTSESLHGAPSVLASATPRDPNIIPHTEIAPVAVVLTLADGSERVEAFSCHLGYPATWPGPDQPLELAQLYCAGTVHQAGPPSTTLADLTGRGAMSWTHRLDAGYYGFGWWTSADAKACDARLVLESATGSTQLGQRHLDPYVSWGSGDISVRPTPSAGFAILADVTTGSGAPSSTPGIRLEAGTYTVRLDTDCPGESHLWVSWSVGS